MSLNLISSVDKNNVIGCNNDLLYDIKEDKLYFKEITTSKNNNLNIVVMGKNTWLSIPEKYRPLPNRLNIIISKTLYEERKHTEMMNNYHQFIFPDFHTFYSKIQNNIFIYENKESAIYLKLPFNEIFIIGGSQLYKHVIDNYENNINKVYLTEINDKNKDKKELQNVCIFPDLNMENYYLAQEKKIITSNYSTQYYETNKNITCNFKILQNKNYLLDTNNINYEISNYFKKNYLNSEEYQYLDIMKDLMLNGDIRETRNATTFSKFGIKMEFDLKDNKIPILTTKRVACKTVIKELLWFINGSTDNQILQEQNVKIWDGNSSREFLDKNGFTDREENDLGPIYGFQWRHSGADYKTCKDDYTDQGIDQLQECIDTLKKDPYSRRMIVCSWNPKDIKKMALPPCHIMFQWYVDQDKRLSLQLYQRSGDFFLGVPFNIMSYSVLIYMVAHLTNLKPGKFIHIIGDAHAYDCHIEAIKEQIKRVPNEFPTFKIKRNVNSINDFRLEDFEIINYNSHETIKADMVA